MPSNTKANIILSNFLYAVLIIFALSQSAGAQINQQTKNIAHDQKTMTTKEKNIFEIVDIAAVSPDNPKQAIKTITLKAPQKTIKCDVFIAGGGLGAVSAALKIWQLSNAQAGSKLRPLHVVLSEETDWLGGQATAQGVSALDENYLVESTGSTANYQKLRHAIRNNYKSGHQLSPAALENKYFNPGNCWVSRLAFEPKVAVQEMKTMLEPALIDSSLSVLYRHKPFYAQIKGSWSLLSAHKIKSLHLVNLDNGDQIEIKAKLFLDATELGDLLALSAQPYVSGAESRSQTNEAHAPADAEPDKTQDFTYPFVVEFRPGEEHTINKPPLYDELLSKGKFSFDGFKMFAETNRQTAPGDKQQALPFWTYRRLIDAHNFAASEDQSASDYPNDLSMINWSSNDVRGKNIIDQPALQQAKYLSFGKLVSLGFLYWLQTEAPRDDNAGKGYPELLLRGDILGTADGLSKHPYIRESRRIKAKYTVAEQDIAAATNTGRRAKFFTDSTGVGLYPIDIHGEESIPGTGQAAKPFQIPLSCLIPEKFAGVLPACKNIGVTHITNGAYRLHSIEWAIGEAQGALSAYALNKKISPAKILSSRELCRDFQRTLIESGVPLYWFNDLQIDHPAFAAGQFLAVTDILPGAKDNLHFYPDRPITRTEIAYALAKLFSLTNNNNDAVTSCLAQGLMHLDAEGNFDGEASITGKEIEEIAQHKLFKQANITDTQSSLEAFANNPLTRAQFAIWLYPIAQSKKLFGKV